MQKQSTPTGHSQQNWTRHGEEVSQNNQGSVWQSLDRTERLAMPREPGAYGNRDQHRLSTLQFEDCKDCALLGTVERVRMGQIGSVVVENIKGRCRHTVAQTVCEKGHRLRNPGNSAEPMHQTMAASSKMSIGSPIRSTYTKSTHGAIA